MDGLCLLVFVLKIIMVRHITGDLQERLDFQNTELPWISELCYQLYDSKDRLACLEPRRNDNIKCTKYVGNGNYAIRTPTNETIIFAPDEYESKECFDIYKGDNVTLVCTEDIDDDNSYGTSLTTPDNFTIWFGDEKCESSITKLKLKEDRTFIANYRFNYTRKKCYKIFKPSEKINFYTCGSSNTSEICVAEYDNCSFFTHHNETIVFGCVEANVTDNFIIVVHNKSKSTIFLEELVTGCVGFVTPSGLRILVYCLQCYNDLSVEMGFFQNGASLPCYYMYDNKNSLSCREPRKKDRVECLKYHTDHRKYGLSTPTNETIFFTSILPNTEACFNVSKRDKLIEVCVENDPYRVSKSLTTSDNFTIWFFNNNCPEDSELMHTLHLEREAKLNDYKFKYKEKRCYKTFDTDQPISPYSCLNSSIIEYCQEEINNCSVITTKHNETVILGCSNETNEVEGEKCIKVIYKEHVSNICLEKLEERCVGFTTPTGLRILADCHTCHAYYDRKHYNNFPWWLLDKCYEMYEEKNMSSCRKPRNESKYACTECIKGETNCTISTPTGETFVFGPPLYESGDCFEVEKGGKIRKVCKETNADATSLTTPDNFTIWLNLGNCVSLKKEQIATDKEIVTNFRFNGTKKRCYKIYTVNEEITPYTCRDRNVYDDCVEEIDNCTVMTTQNNDTVIFGCSNDTDEIDEYKNCIYVLYDDSRQRMCLEKLEERCLGFTTPSGLRILVYCVHCYDNDLYDAQNQDDILPGDPPSSLIDYCYEIYEVKDILSCKKPMKRKNVACFQYLKQYRQYGLLTPTNETILFVPPEYDDADCYDIYKGDKVTRVCKELVIDDDDDENYSLTTPDNFTIWLEIEDCWHLVKKELEEDEDVINDYTFTDSKDRCYKVFKMNETISPYTCNDREIEESCVEEIDGSYVMETKNNETVIFGYTNQTSDDEYRCVDVLYDNSTYQVCLEKVEERCLGFAIPNGSRILVYCAHCYDEELENIQDFLTGDLPEWLMDSCFQVYENKNVLSCKRPLRKDRISCTRYFKGHHKFGIMLPSNETILFAPPDYDDSECFDVIKEEDTTEVCKETVEHGTSLTTPYNQTIWLLNYLCDNDVGKAILVEYEKYVADFQFNYKDRNEYRMYETNEIISAYTCSDNDIFKNKVEVEGNCTVLKTQLHETVVLGCSNETNAKNNCVNVLFDDNKEQVCLEKLEERCVGFTMPSNIRMLVECRSCVDQNSPSLTAAPPNIFLSNVCYEFYENVNGLSCKEPRRRDNVKCVEYRNRKKFGLSTPSGETIIFSPPTYEFGICFDIHKNDKVEKVCRETGPDGTSLTTPDGYTIWLNNKCNSFITSDGLKEEGKYVNDFNFDYRKNECYNIFEEHETISPYTCAKVPTNCLKPSDGCLILTTKYDEVVRFGCSDQVNSSKKSNCIDVTDNAETKQICLEKLEDRCVGFITPRGLRILIACKECFPDDFETKEVERPKAKCYDCNQHKDTISCQESSNSTCMKHFGKERYGFTTDTNETIVFVPPFYEHAEWFNIYKDQAFPTKICKEKVVGGVKFTTLDSFTIWLSNKCNRDKFHDKKIKFQQTHGVFNVKHNKPNKY